jgi:hypothetical protein
MQEKQFKAIRADVRRGIKVNLTEEQAQIMYTRCLTIKYNLCLIIFKEDFRKIPKEIVERNLTAVIHEMEYYRAMIRNAAERTV